jgi:hypothetical protein
MGLRVAAHRRPGSTCRRPPPRPGCPPISKAVLRASPKPSVLIVQRGTKADREAFTAGAHDTRPARTLRTRFPLVRRILGNRLRSRCSCWRISSNVERPL